MSISTGDVVLYDVAGSRVLVEVTATYNSRYGTRHAVKLVDRSTIDGITYVQGAKFAGDIYSESTAYTVSLFTPYSVYREDLEGNDTLVHSELTHSEALAKCELLATLQVDRRAAEFWFYVSDL